VSSCPTSPSSSSACNLLNGADGAVPSFLGHWILRGALIAPGLALAGVRGRQLVIGSIASSSMISMFLLAYTAIYQQKQAKDLRGYRRSLRVARAHQQRNLAERRRRLRSGRATVRKTRAAA
jgi:hypothetical protein